MSYIGTIMTVALTVNGFIAIAFLISENRRPQATLAWALVFISLPGIGLVIYVLFGRSRKAFAKQSKLVRQDLEVNARPLLSPILSRQDAEIRLLEGDSPSRKKLMMLVRRNPQSALTRQNEVEILQNAACFYSRMIKDIEAAVHSIHLQYFIWGRDDFTDRLRDILAAKARAGVEVRILYDSLGSQAHVNRSYVKDAEALGIRMAPTSPPWHLHTISYRNHRKITVIDGSIGYTGGMNIGKEHLDGGRGFDFWRDTQVRIAGEGAAILQHVFMVDWYNAVRENLFFPAYFPVVARKNS